MTAPALADALSVRTEPVPTHAVAGTYAIGIGPSSSHTVGPMRAASAFARDLHDDGLLPQVDRVRVRLHGSLGATGIGHGTPAAVLLGLEGADPATLDVEAYPLRVVAINETRRLQLAGLHGIPFEPGDIELHPRVSLPAHPNALVLTALDATGAIVSEAIRYSVGGGVVVEARSDGSLPPTDAAGGPLADLGIVSAGDLVVRCAAEDVSVSELLLRHAPRGEVELRAELLAVWRAMAACVERGCGTPGELPGGLRVRRRAPGLYAELQRRGATSSDPLDVIDWVNLFALAVNEENASGGRVVTAPTNGAAGIVPAVLHYVVRFVASDRGPEAIEDVVVRFLLAAAAIGGLIKRNASISGAEVGCQGEVGSACAMAAAGLCEVLGGTVEQVENAAEIGIEHNLGLTCDPIGGLVQIPCIERNAVASVKAINAARLALAGDGAHHVSLDAVIEVMRATGADMHANYKETALGGLAVGARLGVHLTEC